MHWETKRVKGLQKLLLDLALRQLDNLYNNFERLTPC